MLTMVRDVPNISICLIHLHLCIHLPSYTFIIIIIHKLCVGAWVCRVNEKKVVFKSRN